MKYEDIVRLNQLIVGLSGGEDGVYNKKSIIALAYEVKMSESNDVFQKAATIMEKLTTGNCFLSANKRTGFEATALYLDEQGYSLSGSLDETRGFISDVARGRLKDKDIRDWLEKHSVKIQQPVGVYDRLKQDAEVLRKLAVSDMIEELSRGR